VAITAAMPSGTGSTSSPRVPERTFDVGIAEQHAVTFAAGLAARAYKPFCAIYSTFLQRAYDQVVHDVAIQSLPVRFAIDRAGLVGADGATHAGSFDVAYLGCLPNFVVMAAADEAELVHMVATAAMHDDRARSRSAIRAATAPASRCPRRRALEIGKGRIVREGKKVAILSLGTRLAEALKAADELAGRGLSTTVADAALRQAARRRADPAAAHDARGRGDDRGGGDRRPRRPCPHPRQRFRPDRRRPQAAHDAPAGHLSGPGQAHRNTGSFRPIRPGEEAPARPIETLSAFVGAHFSDGSGPAATAIRRNGLRPLWLPLALAAGLVLWALLHRG
jgi:hypothetical protein